VARRQAAGFPRLDPVGEDSAPLITAYAILALRSYVYVNYPDIAVRRRRAIYSAELRATTPSAWGYRKMAKAFGLINAFALMAGAVSLVLFY
jgi:hypothetical protein